MVYGLLWNKYKTNFFDPKFEAWKLGPVEMDLRSTFNKNEKNIELKKFDFLINEDQEKFIKLIINKLLKKSLNELIQITHKNPLWLQKQFHNDLISKKNKMENSEILNSFNDISWIGLDLD